MEKKILLIDSKVSNIKSIINALNYLNVEFSITETRFNPRNYEYVILAGVGHFGKFAYNIKSSKLDKSIFDFIEQDKFFLGICVGMQYLFESSEESIDHKGLGIIKGKVQKFNIELVKDKVPLIGKKKIKMEKLNWKSTILKSFSGNTDMYFLHSYFCKANLEQELSSTSYNNFNFTSSIKIGNIYGVQFHPEKSGKNGLKVLQNFIELK